MSTLRFIHAADLHLGSPMTGLALKNEEAARHFALAGRLAFEKLVDRALALDIRFMLIAGDIYDGEWPDATIGLFFARQLGRLRDAGIDVYLIRGNHDAESRVRSSITLPDNVYEFPTHRAVTVNRAEDGVAIHAQGFADQSCADNLSLTYPEAVPGVFNIGMLHTSLTGADGHADYAPCSEADLLRLGYDYWALGHVHEHRIVRAADPAIVYPGNLQGRNIRESGEKGAVLVTVENGKLAAPPERILTDTGRWMRLDVPIDDCAGEAAVWAELRRAMKDEIDVPEDGKVAVRIGFVGGGDLASRLRAVPRQVAIEAQNAAEDVFHGEVLVEKVVFIAPDVGTVSTLGAPAAPGELAALLSSLASDERFAERFEAACAEVQAKMPSRGTEIADARHALMQEAVSSLLNEAAADGAD